MESRTNFEGNSLQFFQVHPKTCVMTPLLLPDQSSDILLESGPLMQITHIVPPPQFLKENRQCAVTVHKFTALCLNTKCLHEMSCPLPHQLVAPPLSADSGGVVHAFQRGCTIMFNNVVLTFQNSMWATRS